MAGSLVRATVWAALWAFLFWVSRANHPTAMLNAAATTLMVLAAAAAFAVLMQAATRRMSALLKVCIAALCIITAGVVAALAIQAVYDVEIGPDPRRFGMADNIGMDSAVVAVLVALAAALDWSLRRLGIRSQS